MFQKVVPINQDKIRLKEITLLYCDVFNKDDYKSIEERIKRHLTYEGFRGFIALSLWN